MKTRTRTGARALITAAALAFGPHDVWTVGTYDGSGGMRTLALRYTG